MPVLDAQAPPSRSAGTALPVALVATGLIAWPAGGWLLGILLRPTGSAGALLLGFMPLAEQPEVYVAQATGLRILLSGALIGSGLVTALLRRKPSESAAASGPTAADRLGLVFGTALTVLLAVTYLPPGDVWYPTHDFLDSEFVYKVLRGGSPGWFDLDHVIAPLMGGIPLSAFGFSDINPLVNLYVIIDPFLAFSVSEIVARLAAFLGMHLLISRHLLVGRPSWPVIPGAVAFLFSLLPFYEHMTATIAFQPLHIVAILALRSGAERRRWLPVAALYPFVADGLRGGVLLVGATGLLATWDAVRGRRAEARNLVLPTMMTGGITLVGLIRPAHLILATDFVSHRVDWPVATAPLLDVSAAGDFLREYLDLLVRGQYHMGGGPLLLPIAAAVLMLVLARPSIRASGASERMSTGIVLAISIAILSVSLVAAAEESGLTNLAGSFPIPLRVSRVIALGPLLWMLMLTVSMERLAAAGRTAVLTVITVGVVAQGALGSFGLIPKLTGGRGEPLGSAAIAGPPSHMRDHYRIEQFQTIASLLGESPTVVSFDLDPMIAAFNGIATVDGYSFNYPLDHKRRFRAIIAGELERDAELRRYFDDFGSRAYLFFTDRDGGPVFLDFCAASDLGATHVLARNLGGRDPALEVVAQVGDVTVLRIAGPCGEARS